MKKIVIIYRGEKSGPAGLGLQKLETAIREAGGEMEYSTFWDESETTLLVGETSNRFVAMTLERSGIHVDGKPEAVLLAPCMTDKGGKVIVVAGSDARGLMYALHEVGDRVRCNGLDALDAIEYLLEYPHIAIRTTGRFIMSRRDDTWFFSKEFWIYYLKRLAASRFNRFSLISGFDTAYMSPPYPFILKAPGFEDVIAVIGDDPEERRSRTLEIFRFIGEHCHRYGLEFCFGIWQQKPWTENQKFLVDHIPQDDEGFIRYASASVKNLLQEIPEIDALSFRVNLEAGIRKNGKDQSGTHEGFWYAIIDAVRDSGRQVWLDLRAKGLTDSMIEYALHSGLNVTVPTKYWCEHMSLPYHIPQMRTEELARPDDVNSSRRYSYDNLLRKPRAYDMQYRLWNYGSCNLLLWGDPYYVSRFIKSCQVGSAIGYEFSAPLSLKGGHEMIPGADWPIHVHPDMRHYKWEDERYWMWYLSFGRMGYNPDTSPEVWRRELRLRFGASAADMEMAYITSGRILPLITTAHLPMHPSLHYWPELYSGAALFPENNYEPYFKATGNPLKLDISYASSLPSDEALFCSIECYAKGQLNHEVPECYSPLQVRDWYKSLADTLRDAILRILENPGATELPEVKSSIVDFTMMADMAEFHAWKVKAAYCLTRYQLTGSLDELKYSWSAMKNARSFFAHLSQLGTKYYARSLEFDAGTSTRRNGNWQDRLDDEVDVDLADLKQMLLKQGLQCADIPDDSDYASMQKACLFPVSFMDDVPGKCQAGQALAVNLKTGMPSAVSSSRPVVMHYRHSNLREGTFSRAEMARNGENYTAVIPSDYITPDYDLLIYFTCSDTEGNIHIHPGIYHPQINMPYHYVVVENQ